MINVNRGGALSSLAGNLYLGGGSRTYVDMGGSLTAVAGTTVELNGGLLVNNGTVAGITNVNYGSLAKGDGAFGVVNVTEGGRFAPGATAAAQSDVANASFQSGSTLSIELGGENAGTEHDVLASADAAAIDGTLQLSVIDHYVPSYGVPHHVITSVFERHGIFATITGIEVTPTKWLAVTYSATGVDVTAAIPGDADLSGDVGFDDLLVLSQHYSQEVGGTWSIGDFDGSGSIGFDDLLALAQNYGESVRLVDAAGMDAAFSADWALAQSLVPEPNVVGLVAGLIGALSRRRR